MQLLSSAAYGFIKLSIICFCRRLFVVSKRSIFSTTTAALIVITIAWSISFFWAFLFNCGAHVSAHWGSRQDLQMYCSWTQRLDNAYLVSDLILDIITLIVPLPVVRSFKIIL